MKLTQSQIALYIIFIICILFIGYYLYIYNNNDGFIDTPLKTKTDTQTLTNLQITTNLNNAGIEDISTQNKIINYLTELASILDTYKTIA